MIGGRYNKKGSKTLLKMMDYEIRHAEMSDLPAVRQMIDHSRSVMRHNGNHAQWVGYPTDDDLKADLQQEVSYLILQEGRPAGTFALVPGMEPTYGVIDHGRWIDPLQPYATVHRLAAMPGTHGIADAAFSFAANHYPYLRADTHADNTIVRHLLENHRFVYSGIVYMDDGSPRCAYEWWRYDEVRPALRDYVFDQILPRYDRFDAAHRRDHALRVVARSMVLGRNYAVDPELLFAAAAMHDVGLAEGREHHHLASGALIREDAALPQWFDAEQIEIIACAAEDHRASATAAPRSLYGCIVAEADRDVEPETIVRRTVEYGLSHYPELDREGHWQRTLDHLHEKYAEGGYIKLWLSDSPNAAPLAELRALIKDTARLRLLFDQFYK